MKENQELSLKQAEYQYQDSIKNFGSLSMVNDGDKIGDFFDSMMEENQENSHKQYQYQNSIKNFGSLLMVDDGDKKGNFVDSTKKENQKLSHKQGEYQYQDSIKNFRSFSMVDDGDKRVGDFFIQPEKLEEGPLKLKRHWREVGGRVFVPERWGHEGSLREWVDYSSFDKILAPKGLKSAREALMSQGKRARSSSGSNSTSTSTSRMLEIKSR